MKKDTRKRIRTKEYMAWVNMKARCKSLNRHDSGYYVDRGIGVCDDWKSSFAKFHSDMGDGPPGFEIDRIDTNGDYSPENCRWVPKLSNARNRRNSKWWFVDGNRYESLSHAASSLDVAIITIKRWCEGRSDRGYNYPPKFNCWSQVKYEQY